MDTTDGGRVDLLPGRVHFVLEESPKTQCLQAAFRHIIDRLFPTQTLWRQPARCTREPPAKVAVHQGSLGFEPPPPSNSRDLTAATVCGQPTSNATTGL